MSFVMHRNFLKNFFWFLNIFFISSLSYASYQEPVSVQHPFYLGVSGGYGWTTWANLVPKDFTETMEISLPVRVSEGGGVWGVYGGWSVIPAFAFELSYMQYPTAHLYFNETSMYYYDYNQTELTTRTSRIGLAGKFLLTIPYTPIRAYSSFGAAEVHRDDSIVNRWRLCPMFGAGLGYDLTPHITTEIGTEYIAGYGQSELYPTEHYIPFLYSVFFRIGVRV